MKKITKMFHPFSIVLFLLFLYPTIFNDRAAGNTDYMKALSIIKPDKRIKAQKFILRDLSGTKVSLEDHRGKIVFLNFWATWCPPCRIEMPSMEKLYTHFKDNDFTMLAINIRERIRQVKAFKKKFKLNFPILLDSDGKVATAYAARRIPVTYLIDREGYLIGTVLGARDWASRDAFALIEELIK